MNRFSLFALFLVFLLIGCTEHAREFVNVTTAGSPGNATNITNATNAPKGCSYIVQPSSAIVESCISNGGEMVSGVDENGCPTAPECIIREKPSENISENKTSGNAGECGGPEEIACPGGTDCEINASDPLLYGVCVPSEEGICGGTAATQCAEGYECTGNATEEGICTQIIKQAKVTDFCWGTYGESDRKVISINDCGNNTYRIEREGFGSDYAYATENGTLIAECSAFPEGNCDELYKSCQSLDNKCLISPASGLARCPEDVTAINTSLCDIYSPVCGLFLLTSDNGTTISWKDYSNSCYACYDRSGGSVFGYAESSCGGAMLSYCPSSAEECTSKEKVCAMIEENSMLKWKEFGSSCDACSSFANKVTNNVLNAANGSILLEMITKNASAPTLLGFRKGECAGGGAITECEPAFEGMEEMDLYSPICAKVLVGNETTEWRTFINSFSVCALNETGIVVLGYRLGEC